MIAHKIVASVEIGNTTMCKVEENRFIRFKKVMMVFDYVKGVMKEKE